MAVRILNTRQHCQFPATALEAAESRKREYRLREFSPPSGGINRRAAILPSLLTRRRVLSGLAAASLAHASARGQTSPFPKPAVVKPELTPHAFGATGGDPVADTLGWNRAIAEGSANNRPILAKGTYVLQIPQASSWNWANSPSHPVRIAVELRGNTKILANQADIVLAPPVGGSQDAERHLIFGTGLNSRAGSLENIHFEGITFDFRDELGPVHRDTYAIGVTGADNVVRRNVRIRSTGTRAGRGLLAENTRRRRDSDVVHTNIQQGIYTRYERDVMMENISFDGFSEALDFDGPCWDVKLANMSFRNGHGEAQCIDTAGGANWEISDVTAENVASILFIYVKANAWPTYDEFLSYQFQGTPTCVIPEKMVARRVVGRNAGRAQRRSPEVLRIGNRRSAKWLWPAVSPPRAISIENWQLEGGYQAVVNECVDLRMEHLVLSNTDSPLDPQTGAALVLHQGKLNRGSFLSGVVKDVKIRDSKGMGLSAIAGSQLEISDVVVDGYNKRGSPVTNAGVRLGRAGSDGPPVLHNVQVVNPPVGGVDIDVARKK